MVLDEMHFEVLNVLNKLQVADKQQIVKRTGFSNETLSKLLYECVAYGIACENIIQMNDGKKIELYIVDTGGIFALKESGINYRVLPYTSSIDERLKIYRRNIFLTNSETRGGNNTVKFLEEFANPEDFTITSPGVVLLFDSGICRRAGVTEEVEKIAAAIKEKNPSATFYDLAEEKIFSKRY
ncbi:MAG: hypothetical protein K6U74_04495 [Firmicutes bacterium]|nr:hypothetical protein [Bacillota bacterium]